MENWKLLALIHHRLATSLTSECKWENIWNYISFSNFPTLNKNMTDRKWKKGERKKVGADVYSYKYDVVQVRLKWSSCGFPWVQSSTSSNYRLVVNVCVCDCNNASVCFSVIDLCCVCLEVDILKRLMMIMKLFSFTNCPCFFLS